jgi:hypothetical protein
MVDSGHIEVVPTDRFPDVAGAPTFPWEDERNAGASSIGHGRWSAPLLRPATAVAEWTACLVSELRHASPGSVSGFATTFLRMIDLPGDRLGDALDTWWRHDAQGDPDLRFDTMREVQGAWWSLGGALHPAAMSRWLPVELVLWPYSTRWTRLELRPGRTVRPNGSYFRMGNGALDRFGDAIRSRAGASTHDDADRP